MKNISALLFIIPVLVATCVVADDDGFGWLLTTPAERAAIRQWREQANKPPDPKPLPTSSASEAEDKAGTVVYYNGVLIGRHGNSNYWVNGRQIKTPQQAAQLGIALTPHPQQSTTIKVVKPDQPSVFIKPGQKYLKAVSESPPAPHANDQ